MSEISPFIFYCQKVMPAVLDDSLSYYEVLCKLVAKLNDVISATNSTSDQMLELKNYVDHYFDNLDVQQEINNKLDQMAESGELETIIENYLEFNTATIFNTVADMKNASNLKSGMKAKTLGYYSLQDQGGAFYIISSTQSGYSILLNNGLYANMIVISELTIKMFGAVGDGVSDDSQAIQAALNYSSEYKYNYLYFPCGNYLINNSLNIPTNMHLVGNYTSYFNKTGSILLRNSDHSIFNLQGDPYSDSDGNNNSNVIIENIMFRSNSTTFLNTGAIYFFRTLYNTFTNVHFSGNGRALVFDKASYDMRFNNCSFTGESHIVTCNAQDDSYHTAQYYSTNNLIFDNCRWESYTTGPLITCNNYTTQIIFDNPKFEGTLADGSALLKSVINNATLVFNNALITMLAGSNCSILDLQDCYKSNFDIFGTWYVESTTVPLFIFNDVSSTTLNVNPSFNVNNYQLDYYISNTNNVDPYTTTVNGVIKDSHYFTVKKLFSNPQYLNKSNVLNSVVSADGNVPLSKFNIRKSTEDNNSSWEIGPNFNNFDSNITQFIIRSPSKTMARFTNYNSYLVGLVLPVLSASPPDANGQIYVNLFSDTNVPCLNIQISGSNKKIGWGSSYPTTGTWASGSIVFNTSPSVGSPAGWICTTTGTPGVWHPFSNVIE